MKLDAMLALGIGAARHAATAAYVAATLLRRKPIARHLVG